MRLGALVLAAGKSTRIAPVSRGLPKPLLSFGGRPLIEWTLEWLAASGLDDIWINLHHRPEAIRSALGGGERFGLRIRYSHEDTILGTAGGWLALRGEWRDTSLVVYGDNVMRFDLRRFLDVHRRRGAVASVAVFDPFVHSNTGIAGGHVRTAPDGRIVEFREGAAPREGEAEYVNAGAYLLEPEVADRIGPGFQDFGRDVFPQLLESGRVYAHLLEGEGFCLGLDTPECYRKGERMLDGGEVRLA